MRAEAMSVRLCAPVFTLSRGPRAGAAHREGAEGLPWMVVDPRMATTQVSTPAAGDHKRAVSQVTADVPPIASVNETATVAKRGPPKRA